eukprot:TRINITY_DN8276_c0_g1_i1.p1 TRINITY_DN8276_c0_g1~~TRINITY_DN8276_c0_g1_i1.p1  ORF type:complete len:647 (+),score=134.38 TRINITY_DN8276_c0_g1_i1:111-2051(+)
MTQVFEKRAPEDIISYQLYVPTASAAAALPIQNLLDECNAFVNGLTAAYLWHNEDIQLNVDDRLHPLPKGYKPIVLHGATNFGENIEDEWFAVHVLSKLADQFELVLQCSDSDGQLLLIEAAEVLPEWVKPELSVNRTFWYKGTLRLIPLPSSPSDFGVLPIGPCSLKQGLELVQTRRDTIAAKPIQTVLQARLRKYNQESFLENHHHRVRLRLPETAMKVLSVNPELVTHATTAFAYRDPIEMKHATKLVHFTPDTMAEHSIRMTRFSYAQLSHAQCKPPAKFGRMPSSQHPDFKAHMLGCFLTLGLEILANQGGSKTLQQVEQEVDADVRWRSYRSTLESNGYFQGLLEGSKGHTAKLQQAKDHFLSQVARASEQSTEGNSAGLSLTGQERAARTCYNTWRQCEDLPLPEQNLRDDDDEWMLVNDAQLNQLLESYREQAQAGMSHGDESMENMVQQLSAFVEQKTSDLDGVAPRDTVTGAETTRPVEISKDDKIDVNDANDEDEDGLMAPAEDVELNVDNFMSILSSVLSMDQSPQGNSNDKGFGEAGGLEALWQQMDAELQSSAMGKSFEREQETDKGDKSDKGGVHDRDDRQADRAKTSPLQEDVAPVDVDLNLVHNLLQSHASQQGQAGPVTNLLSTLGFE